MAFTASATTELAKYSKKVDWKLELKSPHTGGWVEYNFADFSATFSEDAPARASFKLINTALLYSDEDRTTASIPTIVRGKVKLTCTVDAETQIMFDGKIFRVEPTDHEFAIHCIDWSDLANECMCDVSLEPDRATVVSEHSATATRIYQIDESLGASYGFADPGSGGPAAAFSSAPYKRRAWARTNIRLWDSATVSSATEYPPEMYSIDYTSGAIKILDHDHASKFYYVTNVQAYKETAAGGTNVDVARLYVQAWEHPAADGGPGFTSANYTISDTGIDVDRAFRFKGRIADLDKFIRDELGVFIKQRWDHANQKLKVGLVSQKAAASEDWDLQHPVSIGQPRDDSDLYTSVTVKGKTSLPLNRVTWAAQNSYIYDITSGTPNWFAWDGLNVGANSSFANVIPLMYDSDGNTAAAVHNLASTETNSPGLDYSGGSTKYSEYYNFVKLRIELDENDPQLIQRLEAWLPGSRNINAAAGDQRIPSGGDAVGFWPGVLILVSEDDTTYYVASPLLYGTAKPGSELVAEGDDIVHPRARFVKVLCRAYKHGDKNQSDPGIGLAHLGIYTDIEYEITRNIYPYIHDITGVDISASQFTIAGDYEDDFPVGSTFEVENSTGNDGIYTVAAVSYGAATVITVNESITDPTVDGDIAPCHVYTNFDPTDNNTYFRRGFPNLWARFDSRYKCKEIDLGDQYDEHLANDVALRYLEESIRLFQTVSFKAVCDPRVLLYDTVTVADEFNGDITSILVERVELTPGGTTIEGTNYLASPLEGA